MLVHPSHVMTYKTRITRITVASLGEPLFSEQATSILIDDEAAGEFVVIEQSRDSTEGAARVCIDPDEWPHVAEAVERLLKEIKANEVKP